MPAETLAIAAARRRRKLAGKPQAETGA